MWKGKVFMPTWNNKGGNFPLCVKPGFHYHLANLSRAQHSTAFRKVLVHSNFGTTF